MKSVRLGASNLLETLVTAPRRASNPIDVPPDAPACAFELPRLLSFAHQGGSDQVPSAIGRASRCIGCSRKCCKNRALRIGCAFMHNGRRWEEDPRRNGSGVTDFCCRWTCVLLPRRRRRLWIPINRNSQRLGHRGLWARLDWFFVRLSGFCASD